MVLKIKGGNEANAVSVVTLKSGRNLPLFVLPEPPSTCGFTAVLASEELLSRKERKVRKETIDVTLAAEAFENLENAEQHYF